MKWEFELTANNTSSLLKNANYGENFEAKTGLNLENKKSPQTSKPACGLDFWRRVQDSNPRGHHCPNGFQDHPVMTASVTLHVFSADWFLKKCRGKRREILERSFPKSLIYDTRKPLKIQGFSEGSFQSGVPFSRPPRYDRFGNPPCIFNC